MSFNEFGFLAVGLVIGALIMLLQPVVARLVAQAPKVLADMQETIDRITTMLRGLRNATEVMAEAIMPAPAAGTAATPELSGLPSVTDAILLAPSIVAQATIFAQQSTSGYIRNGWHIPAAAGTYGTVKFNGELTVPTSYSSSSARFQTRSSRRL